MADASVLANAVGDDYADGSLARSALSGQDVSAPDLIDVEVVSVLRRHWLARTVTARRFSEAIEALSLLPIDRYPMLPFMPRAYELRATVGVYAAAYIALAEVLDCPLLTADTGLATLPGVRCRVDVLRRR